MNLTQPKLQAYHPWSDSLTGGCCMKGSIQPHSSGRYWVIVWYQNKKHEKFYNDFLHGGDKFWIRHKDREKCIGYKMADRCLTVIRNDYEAYQRGERTFDLSRYRGSYTDAIPYIERWLDIKEASLKPYSVQYYRHSVRKIIAFFERHPIHLHLVQKDTIQLFAKELALAPKTKRNILGVFKEILRDACDSDRIQKMPRFPTITLDKKPIKWIDIATQEAILDVIPEQHKPIFMWMFYHWRRVGEAVALYRSDYDPRIDAFVIQRSLSGNVIMDSIKTGDSFTMPCHPKFKAYMKKPRFISPFMFTNEASHCEGKRYTPDALLKIWHAATAILGVNIDIHRGLRTSGASSGINEQGMSMEEAQKYGGWASINTLKDHYGDYGLERIRALQNRVVPITRSKSEVIY